MANTLSTQILLDGPRNAVVQIEGVQSTSDLAYQTIVLPSQFTGMDNTGLILAADFRVMRIQCNIEDTITVNLWWDATTPVLISSLNGRGTEKYERFGGKANYAGAGKSGAIGLSTQGWSGSAVLAYTLILELIKQGTL